MPWPEGDPRCPIRRGFGSDFYAVLDSVLRTAVTNSRHVQWRLVPRFQFPAEFPEQLKGADLDEEPCHQSDGEVERDDDAGVEWTTHIWQKKGDA